jgi:signal transduction histidine kinase/iron only hydrogenase large subunit-like protein
MAHSKLRQLVYTEKDLCRVCYTCVRECPVKAISISNGQAEVIHERCIGCGNCITVCSQGAKNFLKNSQDVTRLLREPGKHIALLAPSFPAEFQEIGDYRILVGMLRRLGFDKVVEVGFGADLVAQEYDRLITEDSDKASISSDCPAIVFYIEHYYPHLVPALAPIVSPMVAMTRVMRKLEGEDSKIVFIGPCIAKKAESDEPDQVITFIELRKLFREKGIKAEESEASDFDPPQAGKGAIFPISRGLLQTLNRREDVVEGDITVAEGRVHFREAIREFENGHLGHQHLELLCCEGCIMGPGTSDGGKRFARRRKVTEYVKLKMKKRSLEEWENNLEALKGIDLSQSFESLDRRIETPSEREVEAVLKSMGKISEKNHLNCGACGYDTCREHAIAIVQGLAENEMCLPYTIEKLHHLVDDLNTSNEKLASAREALKQSEKLAHMGQLSAGIAHELNNPLGIITMYANILLDETSEEDPIREDLSLIVEQTQRCKGIVGGLLNFARKNQVRLQDTQIPGFIGKCLEEVIAPAHIEFRILNQMRNPTARLDQDQMMQVMINLLRNAVEAIPGKGKITIRLEDDPDTIHIHIKDNGSGIESSNRDKIFTPFFTTKAPGEGTGLGLPIIYGIVKMHKGKIEVDSNADPAQGETGTTFSITLPRNNVESEESPTK